MTEWIPCGDGFIEADVIRWKEAIWERKGPGKGRALKIGDREVIAEVLGDADGEGYVWLLVRYCKADVQKAGGKSETLKEEDKIKRKRTTVVRGKPERMLWSDETARAGYAPTSKFLERKPVSSARGYAQEN